MTAAMLAFVVSFWGGFWQIFDPLLGDVALFLIEYQ